MTEEKFEILKQKVQPYFEGTNPCHDIMHTERVINLVTDMGEKEGADLKVLKLAALLHDIARKYQDDSKGEICHAKKGAELARKILEEQEYDQEKIDAIIHCIATHRFTKGNPPETKEAKVLFDADKLDSIGAIGIGRAFSFSGSIGSFVHTNDFNLDISERYGKTDCAYRIYMGKLKKIKAKLLTEEGRKKAEERHQFMEEFFNRINKEVNGEL